MYSMQYDICLTFSGNVYVPHSYYLIKVKKLRCWYILLCVNHNICATFVCCLSVCMNVHVALRLGEAGLNSFKETMFYCKPF